MSLLPHSARSQCDITRRYPPHNLRVLTEAKALSLQYQIRRKGISQIWTKSTAEWGITLIMQSTIISILHDNIIPYAGNM